MLLCTKLIKLKLHAAAIEISCYHIIPEKMICAVLVF